MRQIRMMLLLTSGATSGTSTQDSDRTLPTERSMPLLMMTKVIPTASTPRIEICRRMLNRFL